MNPVFAFLLAFFLVPVLAAPTPVEHNHGDFVGVRPGAYEKKTKDLKKITIHPGVIVGGPSPEDGKYDVAMISKNLPHNPPQAPITHFHPDSSVYGNIALSPPKRVSLEHMKPWKDDRTGLRQTPLSPHNLQRLKTAMVPHTGWQSPPPTPPPTPPSSPEPHSPKSPKSPHAHLPAAHSPAAKKGQHVNAVASGSKLPAPALHHPAAGGSKHPSPHAKGSKPNPAGHHANTKGKGKKAAVPKIAVPHPKKPAGTKRSFRSR